MPAKTPQHSAATARFGRTTAAQRSPGAARFGRTPAKPASRIPGRSIAPQPRFKPKTKVKAKPKSGLSGLLGALPVGGSSSKAGSGGGKAKPAAAILLAGAGAVLGGRQLRNKRKDDQAVAQTDAPYFPPAPPSPPAPPTAVNDVAPTIGETGTDTTTEA